MDLSSRISLPVAAPVTVKPIMLLLMIRARSFVSALKYFGLQMNATEMGGRSM